MTYSRPRHRGIEEGFIEWVILRLGLEGCVGASRQAGEKALQVKLQAAVSWARWAEWFHFAPREAGLRKGERLA